MPTPERLSRQRRNNQLMAIGLAGAALLVLLGMLMVVALEMNLKKELLGGGGRAPVVTRLADSP